MSHTVLHRWKNIQLAEIDVDLPNGKSIRHTTIIHPGAAVILPITDDGDILLLRQFRPSLNKWILELPAGTIEGDESPIECARRELIEETGYSAQHFEPLGQCSPLAGFCDEIQYLFVAKGLSPNQSLLPDDDEVINVIKVSLDDIENWIKTDEITDGKTIACLSKAKLCGFLI
ncbi:NUDIX hydrolase [Vibrio algivorus]|uniref:GDP-mannose pyrophosphatase n=1 Tax=Vibrio algivorus TaxID=1667024 RepID=A0ABQ6ENH3_9VIBR|nr:NUDIX hydrolase [Vibrio algivorus]GLT14526.1 ADP-ribose pyrophosphatase [Vibrio algivorus]